jgi:hypothetical protein
VLKTTRTRKSSKHDPILISLAESIGSTLGSLAARADAAQKALTRAQVTTKLEREGKKLVRKGKKLAHDLSKTKLARATRRSLRRAPVKRAVRKVVRKAATARKRVALRRRRSSK